MQSNLSLTLDEMESICELYHQILNLADAFNLVLTELPRMLEKLSKKDKSSLHFLRTYLAIMLGETSGASVNVQTMAKAEGVTERTIQRDLKKLKDLQVVQTMRASINGRWGHPGSRTTTRQGAPSVIRRSNPKLSNHPVLNQDTVDGVRSLMNVENVLFRMPAFRTAYEQIASFPIKIAPYIQVLMEQLQKIPEMNDIMVRLRMTSPPDLEELQHVIAEERVQTAVLYRRVFIDEEMLPVEEEQRLSAYSPTPEGGG